MKYDIILTDNEIETILNLEYTNLGEAFQKIKKELPNLDLSNSRNFKFVIGKVLPTGGKLEFNPKNLRCPNCNGKYVVRTHAGDLYYRLLNGNKKQKEKERQRFERMGLHSNPWPCADYYTRDYLCLNCGVRWNNQNEDLYRDLEEIKNTGK